MPYYGVYKGKAGSKIYETWPETEAAVRGQSGCKFKKFSKREDAEEFTKNPNHEPIKETPPVEVIHVYTDGSATLAKNTAGVGVYFPDAPQFNLSEQFNQPPNTNQRAELYAAIRALQIIKSRPFPKEKQLIYLYTDSKYLIGCATTWRRSWECTNFRKATISNRALIEQLWQEIDSCTYPVRFEWVRGHSNSAGNIAADTLAGAANI